MFKIFRKHPNLFSFQTLQLYNRALNHFLEHKKPFDVNRNDALNMYDQLQIDPLESILLEHNGKFSQEASNKSKIKGASQLHLNTSTNPIDPLTHIVDEEKASNTQYTNHGQIGQVGRKRIASISSHPSKNNKVSSSYLTGSVNTKERIYQTLYGNINQDSSKSNRFEEPSLPHIEILLLNDFEAIEEVLKKFPDQDLYDPELVYCIFLRLKQHLVNNYENMLQKKRAIEKQKAIKSNQKRKSKSTTEANISASESANNDFNVTIQDLSSSAHVLQWLNYIYTHHKEDLNSTNGHPEDTVASWSMYESQRRLHSSPLKGNIPLQQLIFDCCMTHADIEAVFNFLNDKKEVSIVQKMWGVYTQRRKFNEIEERLNKLEIYTDWEFQVHPADLILNHFKSLCVGRVNVLLHESFILAVLLLFVQSRKNWRFIKEYYTQPPRFLKDGGHSEIMLDLIREAIKESEFELLEWIHPCLSDSILMQYHAFRIIMEYSLKKRDMPSFLSIFLQYEDLLKSNPKFFTRDKYNTGNRMQEIVNWMDSLNSADMEELFEIVLNQSISSNALVTACMVKFAHLFVWGKVKEIHTMLREKDIPFSPSSYAHIFESCEKSRNIMMGVWYMHEQIANSSKISQDSVVAYIRLGCIAEDHNSKNEWLSALIRLITEKRYLLRDEEMQALFQTNKKQSTSKILDRIIDSIEDESLRLEQQSYITTGKQMFLTSLQN